MRNLIVVCLTLGMLTAQSFASDIASLDSPEAGPVSTNPVSQPRLIKPESALESTGPSNDIKPLVIPTKIPKSVQRSIPNLAQFFVQFDRHRAIKAKARSIEDWVHMRAVESLYADYEDAMNYLEVSDSCLDEAMMNLITRRHDSVALDPAIDLAKSELDKAEDLILFLVEISKLDI